MATTTTYLGLVKPLGTDKVSVETLNANWEKIDQAWGGRVTCATVAMTLAVSDWSATEKTQTATVTGLGADDTVIVSPAPGSWAAYNKAAVRCTAQTANALTFACDAVPSEALTVQALIFKGVAG